MGERFDKGKIPQEVLDELAELDANSNTKKETLEDVIHEVVKEHQAKEVLEKKPVEKVAEKVVDKPVEKVVKEVDPKITDKAAGVKEPSVTDKAAKYDPKTEYDAKVKKIKEKALKKGTGLAALAAALGTGIYLKGKRDGVVREREKNK